MYPNSTYIGLEVVTVVPMSLYRYFAAQVVLFGYMDPWG